MTHERARARTPASPGLGELRSRADRVQAGKAMRGLAPRAEHARWTRPKNRRDPVEVLERSNEGRLPELVPIRYGRMLRSAFTFLRGAAALMASDLSTTPSMGLRVQACGDCHLMNFGLFASPERTLLFDINDFDETLPAPWEWDIKRLAVSFAVAGRDRAMTDEECRAAAVGCVRSYREHLREYSRMSPLEVWYDRLDEKTLLAIAPDAKAKRTRVALFEKAHRRTAEHLFPKISQSVSGRHALVDEPPVLFHSKDPTDLDTSRQGWEDYKLSLPDERRVLLGRYRLEDVAVKVVGIGSVGTRCLVVLAFSEDDAPLLLQFKEAGRSVLEPYAGKSQYESQGQRVVTGQRLMQASSDIFLGWVRGRRGVDFYVRQLRDMKLSVPIEQASPLQLERYAELCGWTLARSHAKSGDAATISGYLGKADDFDEALGTFALSYARQNEQDHAALVKAVEGGRIHAVIEDEQQS